VIPLRVVILIALCWISEKKIFSTLYYFAQAFWQILKIVKININFDIFLSKKWTTTRVILKGIFSGKISFISLNIIKVTIVLDK